MPQGMLVHDALSTVLRIIENTVDFEYEKRN